MGTSDTTPSAAALAKAALRRLAQAQLEPTPENYARAYAEESGQPLPVAVPPSTTPDAAAAELRSIGQAWTVLVERVSRNLDRSNRQWTAARRKDSLQRVLAGSRSDPQRVLQRLQSLVSAWEADEPADPQQTGLESSIAHVHGDAAPAADSTPSEWPPVMDALTGTVRAGLPADEAAPARLANQLASWSETVAASGLDAARVAELQALCGQAQGLFGHRHRLIESLVELSLELGAGLVDLSEDGSWARGQCELLLMHLQPADEGEDVIAGADAARPTVRGVRAAQQVLQDTRRQQQRLRDERLSARGALKQLIQTMLLEVGELGEHTGRFQAATARHAQAIEQADSLEGLAGVVHAMLEDTRTVQSAVSRSSERLVADRARTDELQSRVLQLEDELRRLSEEVSTDALTQVANRRGLIQAFEAELAHAERARVESPDGRVPPLAVGLIDIDNFKRLNDTLGHAAGDTALKNLAAAVRDRLRPGDHLARFGGEEFVVLMPATPVAQAQQVLSRLQRSLTEALFLHEGREVFVTFSAGVTAWRDGEALQAALERADQALYEAKRTGKNRTCVAP